MPRLKNWLLENDAWPVLAALVVFLALNSLASSAFTTPANWNSLMICAAPFIITAMAQAVPVLSGDGGIDLSVGPLAGMVNALVWYGRLHYRLLKPAIEPVSAQGATP